jgi:hypothetical protein
MKGTSFNHSSIVVERLELNNLQTSSSSILYQQELCRTRFFSPGCRQIWENKSSHIHTYWTQEEKKICITAMDTTTNHTEEGEKRFGFDDMTVRSATMMPSEVHCI